MLKAACIGVVLFLFAGLANAQVPSGNVFLGYSYENTNSGTFGPNLIGSTVSRPNLKGWEGSFEGKMVPWIGFVGDVSGHYGTESFTQLTPAGPVKVNVTGHEQEYMAGLRLSVPIGNFTPFAEGMAGGFNKACPKSFSAAALFETKISGYDAFAAVIGCGTSPTQSGPKSEVALVVAIKGESDYYTVQWAERAAPSDTAIAIDPKKWMEKFEKLTPIRLCPIIPGEAAPYPSCVGGK